MPASLSRLLGEAREVIRDPLYRGSLVLLVNTGSIAVLGFAFWTLAARNYPAAAVGTLSGLSSGIGLLCGLASLGLPNMITRHLASSDSPRGLLVIAVAAITALGGALCAIVILGLGRFLPASLHLQENGRFAALFTALVILASLNNTMNAGLVALRAPQAVLWTNLAGAITKLVALVLLTSLRSSGLVISFSLGLMLSTVLSVPPLGVKAPRGNGLGGSFGIFREYLAATVNNYIATIFGILPSTVVPLVVIAERGVAQAAPFALAFLVAGFLNTIPATTSQVLFAEASRRGVAMGGELRKAIHAIYALLIPVLIITVAAAPFIMHVFGASYAAEGTSSLRILSLTVLVTSGNYLVDSMLIARDRSVAYLFMNGANAALVLGCVSALLHRGLVGGSEGWALGQFVSLLLGLVVIATGKTGRHQRPYAKRSRSGAEPLPDEEDVGSISIPVPGLAQTTVPLMVGTVTGTEELLRGWSTRLTRRPHMARPKQRFAGPGEIAFFGVWFPPLAIPVGPRQVRTSRELPVLIVFSAYSGWISALLIPSLQAPDLLAGCWEALIQLGGMPEHLVWDSNWLRTECERFFDPLGTEVAAADEEEQKIVNEMYVYLEQAFITGQSVFSPDQFNQQLMDWLEADNRRPGNTEQEAPAVLAITDRKALTVLPPRPQATRWHLDVDVQGKPYVRFDSNEYAVDPVVIGRKVLIVADLSRVHVLCEGRPVAIYRRSWSKGAVIATPPFLYGLRQDNS